MSRLISRRACVLAAVVTAGVLGTAGPALADVTVEPSSAVRGSGANLHFTVTNTGTSPITRVKLVMPADTPVAEVYPLSVDDWAPQITPLILQTPLSSIHGGTPVTRTASAITWIAVGGKTLAPGGSADLAVALGPLPAAGSMAFTVQPTYADGKAGPAMPPAVLTLTAAAGARAAGHTAHGGTSDADAAEFAALVEQAGGGPGVWPIAGWVLAALAGATVGVVLYRGGQRAEPTKEAGEDTMPKEPVSAGPVPRVTSWSYRDGPR